MKNWSVSHLKREVVKYCKIIWERGFVANHEGNISVKIDPKRILATPSAMSKGDISENDLIIVDNYGKVLYGSRKPFSEISMHLCIYRNREDVRAVIHAHPPTATGLSVSGIPLCEPIIPEIVISIGKEIPIVPFSLPNTEVFIDNLIPFLELYDVLLLKNHGVLSYGDDITQAYLRLEHCENWAKIYLTAHTLGKMDKLRQSDVNELLRARRKAGLGPEGRRSP